MQNFNQDFSLTNANLAIMRSLFISEFTVLDDHNPKRQGRRLEGVAIYTRDEKQYVVPCFGNTQFCINPLTLDEEGVVHISRNSVGGTSDTRGKAFWEGRLTTLGYINGYVSFDAVYGNLNFYREFEEFVTNKRLEPNAVDFVLEVDTFCNTQYPA